MGRAHRVAWVLYRGKIPRGKKVLHRCDNPPCCNPEHLFLGTQADNVADMVTKGRRARNVGTQKLSMTDIVSIRAMAASGAKQTQLAELYGVNQPHISRVVRRESWKHVL